MSTLERKPSQIGPTPKYPWDRWFNRSRPKTIWQGRDYDCRVNSMNTTLRKKAAQKGRGISIQNVPGGGIRFVTWDLKTDEPRHFPR